MPSEMKPLNKIRIRRIMVGKKDVGNFFCGFRFADRKFPMGDYDLFLIRRASCRQR